MRRSGWHVLIWVLSILATAAPALAERGEHEGFKVRVFEIKHQEAEDLVRVIRPFASGAKGASMVDSDDLRTITVRDLPENLVAIEEAIKRLDVATAPKPDIELRLRILIASPSGPSQVPPDLESVVKQLQATLTYKTYHQIASVIQRVRVGSGCSGKGVAQVNPPVASEAGSISYSYSLDSLTLPPSPSGGGAPLMQMKRFRLEAGSKTLGEANIATGLTLREGEKIVVGTASLTERAMIVVVTARILK